ncbi:TonB-dependent siderophore receptor [Variovorax sp. RKNM96]|uniref:TonB-dependent siderophore receptor n=1 Tax=Variovorax sp. RKNM96 TaxID=2681552 RepID=UPI001980FAB9|nr:TonB-dependent siderophore receptor [Variovorax sp. RKNM96]QSI32376.1 TonB-dependent siderophore receptor [Variovorax sp. RKNM96]
MRSPPLPRQRLLSSSLAAAFGAAVTFWSPAASAQAQTPAQATPPAPATPTAGSALPEVRVTAEGESPMGPVTGFAAKRSLSGTKTDTPILEIPQSISVIGRDEMNARGVQNAMDAVRYTPGVITNINGPDNRGWEDISIRGFPAGLSIYQNGLAQTPFNVTNYISDPYMFERVEVLRGPSSMIFGQGDAGGITNRVTKLASGERNREIELQIGNHQRKQLAFDIGDRFGETSDWSYRLIGVGLDSNDEDRYPDGHKLNRTRTVLAPSLQWKPSARTSLTLYGEYIKNSSAEDTYFVPDKELRPTALKMGDYSFSGIAQQQKSIGYRFQHEFADGWTVRQNYRFSQLELQRRVVWTTGLQEDGRTLDRVARTWNDPMSQSVMDTSVEGKFKTGSVQHTMLWGIDFSQQKGSANQYSDPAPTLDFYQPVYGQYVPYPTTPLNIYRQDTRQIGYYMQDQIKFDDRWVLTLGGRKDHVRQITNDPLNSSLTIQPDRKFSGRAGLTYLFDNGVAPYISYAESFLPSAGLDANKNPFKPTSGKQVEVGVKYQPAGSRLLLTAAVFDLRKSNVVSYDPETFEGRQIGKVRSRGIELEAKGELLPGLSISGSYTRMNVKVTSSSDPEEIGKGLPEKPKEIASVWLDYTMGKGLGFGGGVRHVGRSPGNEHNTFFSSSYTVLDAAIRYEQGPWRYALNVSNLGDKKYIASCYVDSCYSGARRSITLTARYKF